VTVSAAGLGLVTHPDYLLHAPHAEFERAVRLEHVLSVFQTAGVFDRVVRVEPVVVPEAVLTAVHRPEYLGRLAAFARAGGGAWSPDTVLSPESYDVARLAAGGAVAAVDAVLDGRVGRALALVRPPGHHAGPNLGTGFCLINNVAVAARHALRTRGIERVLIVDWDVHHGNGTQDVFYDDGDVLFFSIHQAPLYPGTGWLTETGRGRGEGRTVNVPVPPGAEGRHYRRAFEEVLEPLARAFEPRLVLVSVGLDAHRLDPLAEVRLTVPDFAWLARTVRRLADQVAGGRLVGVLEGGYHLAALGASLLAVADAWGNLGLAMAEPPGEPAWPAPPADLVDEAFSRRLAELKAVLGPFWPGLRESGPEAGGSQGNGR